MNLIKDLNKVLLKKYKPIESVFILISIYGFVSVFALYLGNGIYICTGTIFILVGIYGFILQYYKSKSKEKNDKSKPTKK